MKRRSGTLLLMALLAGASGCAGTARRDDGSSIFGPRAWNVPEAPPQRAVTLTSAGSDTTTDPAPHREGLARYFPVLAKRSAENPAPTVAKAKYVPTWFGLRPAKPATSLTYTSDTREQLNRMGATPSSLPVALQVPTERAASDSQVTPTGAEIVADGGSQVFGSKLETAKGASLDAAQAPGGSAPDFGGKPSGPGEDEVNPLPPAAEPGSEGAVVNRMPQVPAVDPVAAPSTERPETRPASTEVPAADDLTVKASTPPDELTPPQAVSKPTQTTSQVTETSKVASPATPAATVYASPQGETPRPTSQVTPSGQVKPSPQATAATHTWKRPCLRRLVRKVCKMGEYADPPTAAPH